MDVSTQVVPQTENQVYSVAQMNNMARVQEFRDALTQAHATCVNLNNVVSAEISKVQDLINSRASLIEMFKTDAMGMFPELAGLDMNKIMASLSDNHPLSDLWNSYLPKVNSINAQVHVIMVQADADMKGMTAAYAIEKYVIDQYQDFFNTASTQVPTVGELTADLTALQVIPTAQDSSLVASIPAIEMLDPEAADMVMKQAANNQEAASDANIVAGAASAPSDIKPAGILIGLLGLAYIFLGGDSK